MPFAILEAVRGGFKMAKQKQQTLPDVGFVRLPQVLSIYPVSRTTWFDGIRDGKYPKPVKLAERISAWRVEDIRRLIEERGQ
jgi:prophage regulatory protein